jgi:hypothetical protein
MGLKDTVISISLWRFLNGMVPPSCNLGHSHLRVIQRYGSGKCHLRSRSERSVRFCNDISIISNLFTLSLAVSLKI